MIEKPESNAAQAIRIFSRCLWGAAVAFFLVGILVEINIKTSPHREVTKHQQINLYLNLDPFATIPWQEEYERRMYALSCVLCPLFAWGAARWFTRLRSSMCILALIPFVYLMNRYFAGIFQGKLRMATTALAMLALALPLLWRQKTAIAAAPPQSNDERPSSTWTIAAMAFVLVAATVVLFFQHPYKGMCASYCTDTHCLSFVCGPSLFFLNPSSVPAIDFESHYGIGPAYVFSFLQSGSIQSTGENYFWFLIVGISFYYVTGMFALSHLFRSAWTAFLCSIVLFLMGIEANSFRFPSNWPIRYPFLFLFIAAAAQERLRNRVWVPPLLAGALAGLSIFWQTDVGLYFAAAGLAYYVAMSIFARSPWWRAPLFVLGTLAAFFGLCGALFGPAVFSPVFVQRLFEPLLLYATGFGFELMNWKLGWTTIYNLIAPCMALATIGWTLFAMRGEQDAFRRQQYSYMFLFSVVGQLMSFKWVNRSIDVVWSINGAAMLVVLFWWTRIAALAFGDILEKTVYSVQRRRWIPRPRLVSCTIVVAGLVAAAIVTCYFENPKYHGGSSSPLVRIFRYYRDLPTEVSYRIRRSEPDVVIVAVQPEDVAFIKEHSQPREPVAIISIYDCIYLIEAKRPPRFHWAQLFLTHTPMLVERVTNDLEHTDTLFLEKGGLDHLKLMNPTLHAKFAPIVERDFVVTESSPRLELLRRKPTSAQRQATTSRTVKIGQPN